MEKVASCIYVFIPVTTLYTLGEADAKKRKRNVFIVFVVVVVHCVCTIAITGIGFSQLSGVFSFFIPLELMESNPNLFRKLIPVYSLPMWFQFTTKTRTRQL